MLGGPLPHSTSTLPVLTILIAVTVLYSLSLKGDSKKLIFLAVLTVLAFLLLSLFSIPYL